MPSRYRAGVRLTSLMLALAVIGATPRPSPPPLTCLDAHRLYSRREFHRARAFMLLELAQKHARRAELFVGPSDQSRAYPQETPGPRLKHLLAILARAC